MGAEKVSMKKAHPASELFPLMDDVELRELSKDIRENGQRDPIVLFDGMILDGRNRQAACAEANVNPKFVKLDACPSPIKYVLSKNLRRRHLKPAQRATIAVNASKLLKAEARERQRAGQKSGGRGRKKLPPRSGGRDSHEGETLRQAAKLAGAGKGATEVMASIERRAPEVFAAVTRGEVETVADAQKLAAIPDAAARSEAVHLVKNGVPVKEAIRADEDEGVADYLARKLKRATVLAEKLNHELDAVLHTIEKRGIEVSGVGTLQIGFELVVLKKNLNRLQQAMGGGGNR